jgi:hypothetical protein
MKLSSPYRQEHPFHIYQTSTDQDYFFNHPNTVLLGFLGAVATVLLLLMLVVWVGYQDLVAVIFRGLK